MAGLLQLRVSIQHGSGIPPGTMNQAHITQPLGKLHSTQPALSCSQHIARAAQAEIFFRNFEPIERAA